MGILQQLRAGAKNRKTIMWPGTQIPVDIKILTDADEQSAEFAAENLFKQAKLDIAFHNVENFQLEQTTQKLYRALRVPGTDDPVEPDISAFKQQLTRIERDLLVDEMNAFYEEWNPNPRTMPAEEFDAMIESLKKKPRETILSVSSFATLKLLAIYLANQLATSQAANGVTSSR